MSRFAIAPQQLLYLPPTMSPSATSSLPGLLEHPAEAFAYYRAEGVAHLVCQEKHMGSRAVALVRRADLDPDCGSRPGAARCAVHPHRALVLPRRRVTTAEFLARLARAVEARGAVRRARQRLGAARRRAAAVVGEGRRPHPQPVRRRRRRRPRRRARPPCTSWSRLPPRGLDVAAAARAAAGPRDRTRRCSPTPTAGTAGRPTGSTASRSRPFQVLAARRPDASTPASTPGTSPWPTGSPTPTRSWSAGPRTGTSTSPTPTARPPPRSGGRR